MVIYPRRHSSIENCTDLAIGDIELYAEDPCNGTADPNCQWTGYLRVNVYNQFDKDLDYLWEVESGGFTIVGDGDEVTESITLNADEDTLIVIKCTITNSADSGDTDFMISDFETNHSGVRE